MKLLTKGIEQKFEKNPIGSKEGQGLDAKIIVKYFNPYGSGTWLITEAEKQEDGDWLLFGYFFIHEWEWGYVLLSEIQNARVTKFKLGLERDLYTKLGTVKEYLEKYGSTYG